MIYFAGTWVYPIPVTVTAPPRGGRGGINLYDRKLQMRAPGRIFARAK